MAFKRSRTDGDGRRVFECKTCNKQFSSFQALGGHRTGHKRMKVVGSEATKTEVMKKVYGCPVCGVEFPMGQALGGHMTRHRRREYQEKEDKTVAAAAAAVLFDLNLPPMQFDQFYWDEPPMIHFF